MSGQRSKPEQMKLLWRRIQEGLTGVEEDDEHIDYLTRVLDRMKERREQKMIDLDALREDLAQLYLESGAVSLEIHDPAFPKRFGAVPGVRVVVRSHAGEEKEVLADRVFQRDRDEFFAALRQLMETESFSASMVLRALMHEGVISSEQRIVLNKQLYCFKEDAWELSLGGI